MTTETVEYTLERTGLAPMRFVGEKLSESDGFKLRGVHSRYHILRLFRASAGDLVCAVTYRTTAEIEPDYLTVHVGDQHSIQDMLFRHDTAAHARHYCADAQLRDIRLRYLRQVSEMLEEGGIFDEL